MAFPPLAGGPTEAIEMRSFLCAAVILAGIYPIVGTAQAEPIPLPKVDYAAKAKMMGGSSVSIRHSGGKIRMDIQPHGVAQITGIMDLSTRKMIMIGAIPGMKNMAMEFDVGKDASYGQVMGEGKKVGTATVAGESCELWEADPKAGFHTGAVTTCLSRDNIPLRTEAIVEGKRRTIMEVTELQRAPQEPALFAMPANVQVVKLPKGANGGPVVPPLPSIPDKQ